MIGKPEVRFNGRVQTKPRFRDRSPSTYKLAILRIATIHPGDMGVCRDRSGSPSGFAGLGRSFSGEREGEMRGARTRAYSSSGKGLSLSVMYGFLSKSRF
jgi:hypothetical protein